MDKTKKNPALDTKENRGAQGVARKKQPSAVSTPSKKNTMKRATPQEVMANKKRKTRLWDECYADLAEYKNAHGHCNVSPLDDPGLAEWVSAQRRRKSSDTSHAPLHPFQIERLDAIGFVWEADPVENETRESVASRNEPIAGEGTMEVSERKPKHRRGSMPDDAKWLKMYASLSEFKRVHGDCLVRCGHNNKILGNWVATQRSHNRMGKLRSDRKKLLDEIGFCWNLPPHKRGGPRKKGSGDVRHETASGRVAKTPSKGVAKTSAGDKATAPTARVEDVVQVNNSVTEYMQMNEAKWKKKYELLLEYKRVHGDCLVPYDHKILGPWVINQRQRHRSGKLPSSRKKLLDEIGFCWKPPPGKRGGPRKKGSGAVRHQAASGRVAKRPPKVAAKTSAGDTANLPITRGEDVAQVNSSASKRKQADHAAKWKEKYELLLEYKRIHGDCLVPYDDQILGTWVSWQRYLYQHGKLHSDRKKLLNDIGFCWNPPRKKPRRKPRKNGSQTVQHTTAPKRVAERPVEDALRTSVGDEAEYPVGTQVNKFFEGYGWFVGEVTSFDGEHYTVTYEDGDDEELIAEDLAKVVLSYGSASEVEIGSRVAVHWPDDGNFYKGTVTKQRSAEDPWCVEYDDGDFEWLDLCKCKFHLLPARTAPGALPRGDESDRVTAKAPGRSHHKYAVGTTVRNVIGGLGWANGSVTGYDGSHYEVTYENGDEEVFSDNDLAKVVPIPDPAEVEIGSRVAVHCPRDGNFYAGTVTKQREGTKPWYVDYDEDGTNEWLSLGERDFHLLSGSKSRLSDEETNDDSRLEADPVSTEVEIGSRISVQRPEDGRFYEGFVTQERNKIFLCVNYDEGTWEWIDVRKRKYRALPPKSGGQNDEEVQDVSRLGEVGLDSRLSVYWPEKNHYYEGTVTRHRVQKGHYYLEYDDGTCEWIDLRRHKFRLLPGEG